MKIATKLTKRVAEFVNERGIGISSEGWRYRVCEDYFHYPGYFNGNHRLIFPHEGYTSVSEQEFIDMVTAELFKEAQKTTFNPQPHYNNDKGSLYKIAAERNWNAYVFDIVKRLERGGKKDPLRQEIEKSIDVLKIWLNELPE